MDNRPIGIFDSGTGGLTSVRQLALEAPEESFVFFGDTIRAPYGGRSPEEIKLLSRRNARFLRSRDVKAIIVSCNTSTANAMAELAADNRDIPIVGTVAPAAAEAVRHTTVPILLIHGEDDRFVPCDMGREIAAANPAMVELHTFPDAGHGLSFLIDRERYERVAHAFFARALATAQAEP